MSSIKIVGVGWHKTGTTTLRVCLEKLGYKHKSYDEYLVESVSHGDLGPVFEVANKHESFDDFPWPILYKEIDKKYENTKFILTTRKDSNVWYDSLCRYVERNGTGKNHEIVYGYKRPHGHKKDIIRRYKSHNEEVRSYFKGRNDFIELCWEKGDRWEKLCNFIGRVVPEESFPHANKSPENLLDKIVMRAKNIKSKILS